MANWVWGLCFSDLVSDLKTGLYQAVESLNLNGGLDDLLQPVAGLLGLQGIK